MVCGKCGRVFDEGKISACPYCRTVHTPSGEPVRDIRGVLCYIAERFGQNTLLDRRRTDALIADIFPKESAVRRLCHVALYDGCAQKLWAVRGKPFEVRSAAAARCVISLRDEIGLKGRTAATAVEAVAAALGCDIAFKMEAELPAAETESRKNITDSAEQYSLGRHFDRIKDYGKAMYWFTLSAQQDCAEAEYYPGFYLMEGRGGVQDVKAAREWFLRAAENGVPAAEYMTGYFYAEGIACGINEAYAFEWFLRAAKQCYEPAVEMIALCYESGTFVDRDPETARRWRKLLPEQPLPEPEEKPEEPEQETIPLSSITYPSKGDRYGRITIAGTTVDAPVYYGDTNSILNRGVGTYVDSSGAGIPGESKTILMAGHNNTFFNDLQLVEVGDVVTIETHYGTYTYTVERCEVRDYQDTTTYDFTRTDENLILYTCYPFDALGFTPNRYFVYASYTSGPELDADR